MRFAVLHHTLPESSIRDSHWDLLLQFAEYGSQEEKCLDCFELDLSPDQWYALKASRLPSHRALYLDYSGPISGDRGSVEKVLAGNMQWFTRDENFSEFELFAYRNQNSNYWNAKAQRFKLTGEDKDQWFLQLLTAR